jgi:serine phosphatase RsbU (regulator of sigma subunit)
MDICLVNIIGTVVEYAGANRSLYIKRNTATELEEIKPDKRSIGGGTEVGYEFKTHIVQLAKGDTIYLTTDGFQDQFGGEKNKKFSSKRMKELFAMPDITKAKLLEEHQTWKGNMEQVDDILVIAVRL